MRNVTVAEIFRRARKRADMTSSGFYTDQDCFDLLNSVYTNLFDLIVESFQNYFYEETTFVTDGNNVYDLPADFYKLILMEEQTGVNTFQTIFAFNELERNSIATTDANVPPGMTIKMRYIPVAPVFTELTDEFDGFNGWDELVVLDMAIAMLESEESTTDSLERRRAQLFQRLQSISKNRDVTLPGSVTDVTGNVFGMAPDQLQYRFYGNTIEFLNVTYLGI